jgi:hypothetical protein
MSTEDVFPIRKWEHGRLDEVRKVSVIRVRYARGAGIEGNPIRQCVAYYTEGGELISDHDPEADHGN